MPRSPGGIREDRQLTAHQPAQIGHAASDLEFDERTEEEAEVEVQEAGTVTVEATPEETPQDRNDIDMPAFLRRERRLFQ